MEESEDEDLPAFDVVSSSAVGERDVNRVLQVFPDIGLSKDEIRRHIRKSGSTEATINHILDNQLEVGRRILGIIHDVLPAVCM